MSVNLSLNCDCKKKYVYILQTRHTPKDSGIYEGDFRQTTIAIGYRRMIINGNYYYYYFLYMIGRLATVLVFSAS